MKWINEFLEAADKGLTGMDFNTLEPVNFLYILPLYPKEGISYTLKIIKKAKGHDIKKIAKNMISPSAIRVMMVVDLIKARLANLEKERFMQIAEFYSSMLRSVCLEDLYAEEKNIIHKKEEIKHFIKNLKKADPGTARILGRLSNACYHLAYGLYGDIFPTNCYENFGPYDVSKEFGKGYTLIIKQFRNLKPVELLGDRVKDLPFNKIRIYCVYKDVKFSIDAVSHTNYKGDTINGLKFFAVDINRNLVYDLSKIKKATETIEKKAVEMWKELKSLNPEEAKIRYLEQECYNFLKVCKMLNIDWRPTKKMIKAVKDKPLLKKYFWPKFKTKKEESKFWKAMIDPRIRNVKIK